jgi:hypothetical protein
MAAPDWNEAHRRARVPRPEAELDRLLTLTLAIR